MFVKNAFDKFRPTFATPKVLEKAGLKLSDIDVFEYHEAFAVSTVSDQEVYVFCSILLFLGTIIS